jgi:hypothetical protein
MIIERRRREEEQQKLAGLNYFIHENFHHSIYFQRKNV